MWPHFWESCDSEDVFGFQIRSERWLKCGQEQGPENKDEMNLGANYCYIATMGDFYGLWDALSELDLMPRMVWARQTWSERV